MTMTDAQTSFLDMGKKIRQDAGTLLFNHLALQTSSLFSPPLKVFFSQGLSKILRDWDMEFGYASDCTSLDRTLFFPLLARFGHLTIALLEAVAWTLLSWA